MFIIMDIEDIARFFIIFPRFSYKTRNKQCFRNIFFLV